VAIEAAKCSEPKRCGNIQSEIASEGLFHDGNNVGGIVVCAQGAIQDESHHAAIDLLSFQMQTALFDGGLAELMLK
jgi:hypothetical protein